MSVVLSDYDLERRRGLERARRRATALLVAVTAVFVFTFTLGESPWVGFLRTTMEASMIGGLADWFAVTALFRHPLGLPIPHTAIIPRSKEGLARSLGEFVRHNFLSPDQLVERLEGSRLPEQFGQWLVRGDNAAALAGHLSAAAETIAGSREGGGAGEEPPGFLAPFPLAGWVGRVAESAVTEGRHQQVMGSTIAGLASLLEDNRDLLRHRIGQESPWWVPAAVDDAVFARAYEALHRFLREVAADPDHELRRAIDRRLVDTTRRLQSDPEWQQTVNARLAELIDATSREIWSELSRRPAEEGSSPRSHLEVRLTGALRALGQRLASERDLAERVEAGLRALAGPLARVGQRELGDLIAATVQRWDAADTSRRLELWMGRDLQFVRINGTVVGGLAGLVIHTAVFLVAG